MKKFSQLPLLTDCKKSLISDSKFQSPIVQQKDKNLFTKISFSDSMISDFNSSLKTISNLRKNYAILIKYKKIKESKILEQRLNRKVRSYSSEQKCTTWLTPNNAIRRQSCFCYECGISNNKLTSLTHKCPFTLIVNNLPRVKEKRKKRTKERRPTVLKVNTKEESSPYSPFDIHLKYIKTKFGVINLLPAYQLEKYLSKPEKFIKKLGSLDDQEILYFHEAEPEKKQGSMIISMSKLDYTRKKDEKKEKENQRRKMLDSARFSEESESDIDSQSSSKKKSLLKMKSQQNLYIDLKNENRLKLKMQVILQNVLQRNRLTRNNTIVKFLGQKSNKEINNTNDSGKLYSFMSLHQIHSHSQQQLIHKNRKNLFHVKSGVKNLYQERKLRSSNFKTDIQIEKSKQIFKYHSRLQTKSMINSHFLTVTSQESLEQVYGQNLSHCKSIKRSVKQFC